MLANTARLLLVTAAATLFATSAGAQEIDPRCVKVKDKVKCTCFVTNGGLIERGSAGAWRMRIYSMGQPSTEAAIGQINEGLRQHLEPAMRR